MRRACQKSLGSESEPVSGGGSWAAKGRKGGPGSPEGEGKRKSRAACVLDARGRHP
jgi:hypothetical protein